MNGWKLTVGASGEIIAQKKQPGTIGRVVTWGDVFSC